MADQIDIPVEDDTPMAPPEMPPEMAGYGAKINRAAELNKEEQKALAEYVVATKNFADSERAGYMERRKRHLELWNSSTQGFSASQKNIVYVVMPFLMKAILLFHNKVYKNRFPPNGDIVSYYSPLLRMQALVAGRNRHMNHYLRKVVKEYLTAHDRGGIQILLFGSGFSVWYYDPVKERCCFEFISSDDLYVPYKHKSDLVDMSDLPWIIWRKKLHRHELEGYAKPGADGQPYYINVETLYDKPSDEKSGAPTLGKGDSSKDGPVSESSMRFMGLMKSPNDSSRARDILEMDCWLAPPFEPDGTLKPYTVCVDEASVTLMRLVARDREDPKDRLRYNAEEAQLQAAHDTAMAMHDEAMMEHQTAMAAWEDSQVPQPVVDDLGQPIIDPATNAPAMSAPEPTSPPEEPIPPPEEPEQPQTQIRRIPFNRFTHYPCIPNPEGYYGYGLGYLIEGPQITASEVMSLYTSLFRLNTMPTAIMPRLANMPRGTFKLELGTVNEVEVPVGQWGKGDMVKFLQFPQPDPNAFKIVQLMDESAQAVTADDIAGGGEGMSGQTATESVTREANSMDSIASIGARIIRSQNNEIDVLTVLLSETLDDNGEIFAADDPEEGGKEYEVTREDYMDVFEVALTCDPNIASQPARERQAMKVMQGLTTLPPGTFDPVTTVGLLRLAAVNLMKALEARDMVVAMQLAPPVPPPVQGPPNEGGENGNGPTEGNAGGEGGGEPPAPGAGAGPANPDMASGGADATSGGAPPA